MYGSSFEDDDNGFVEDEGPTDLSPCSNCGRNFNQDSLARHQKICSKTKTRKPFNSSKQRLEGLEKSKVTASTQPKKVPKKKDWRREHEEFVKTIRNARGVTNAIKTGGALPPPPAPTINPDYIQCEHCDRRFAESAAERHINFCKEQKSRFPKASSDSKFDQKKEKQKIRTQYRPPLPGQKKGASTSTPSPAKPRGSSSSHSNIPSPGTKPDSSPSGNRKTSSKTKQGRQEEERKLPATNSRYSKSGTPDQDSGRSKSGGKNKQTGNPDWFDDLERGNSGKQRSSGRSRGGQALDDIDSGLDLNDNYEKHGSANSRGHGPVGVVRPSSRTKDKDVFGNDPSQERSPASAGRRQKLANFCHDCGTKYPISNAKFCCECGVRRMALI